MSKKDFFKGAIVLSIAGVLVKVMGLLYRIPIANLLKDRGSGYIAQSFYIYTILFAISSSGINVAVAKLVSEKRALKDYKGAHRVFKLALIILATAGFLSASLVYFGAKPLLNALDNPNAYYATIALVPALFFVPIMSAFRGYFQGRKTMVPTALSQIVEQFIRVLVGLYLTYILLGKGLDIAAGGASFGTSAGAIAATILIIGVYFKNRNEIKLELNEGLECELEETKTIVKRIISIALPLTVGALIIPALNFIDSALIPKRIILAGIPRNEAPDFIGQISMAQTVINFTQTFSVALMMSIVPLISDYYAKKDNENIKRITRSAVRMTLLMGLPAGLGIFVLSTDIIGLIYYENSLDTIKSVGGILRIAGIGVIFLTLVQTLTATLQGLGKPSIAVRNLGIGALVKIILSFILLAIPSINIKGAAISTVATYIVAALLDFIAVIKYTKTEFSIKNIIIKPFVSSGVMAIIVFLSKYYLVNFLDKRLVTLIAIFIGIAVYFTTLFISGSVTKRDLMLLPAGEKISKYLERFGLVKA
ncbi:MAG: polysaccharide biosynthesis protein [Firmicutes bacterium]|nr:polysaccharide biosynthesis protein [Bacillota bacterium]